MKLNRILILATGILLFSQVSQVSYGEVVAGDGVKVVRPGVSAQVITSNGSMRLVKYTRSSASGVTNYIRREVVADGRVKGRVGKSSVRLVSSAKDHRRMQSHYVVSKPSANVVSYAPVREVAAAKGKVVSRPVEGFGNVYNRQGYSHPAYMKSKGNVVVRKPVKQASYGYRDSGGVVRVGSDNGWSVSVTIGGGRGYYGSQRHVNGYRYGGGWRNSGYYGRGRSYYGGGNKHRGGRVVRGSIYPRALGDGMYVSKQPRYGYGNYGVRYVARTSNYGHTLTTGACVGSRY